MNPNSDSSLRHLRLSPVERRNLMWNQMSSRLKSVPDYNNSLLLADTRVRRCNTCGQRFVEIKDLKKHISLAHSGTKSIVCPRCGIRFASKEQLVSHSPLHNEPRLQEFDVLIKRKNIIQEPRKSAHTKSVNGYQGMHVFPESDFSYSRYTPSFGTHQTIDVPENAPLFPSISKRPEVNDKYRTKGHEKLPDVFDADMGNVKHAQSRFNEKSQQISIPSFYTGKSSQVPGVDPGNVSVIGSVMGMSRMIETSQKSRFIENTEDQLIKARLEAMSLAGPPPSPKSYSTRSELMEYRKLKFLVGEEFHKVSEGTMNKDTHRLSRVSGYDPFINVGKHDLRKGQHTSKSFNK